MRIGILDIGSNSAHLQVIDGYPGAQPLTVFRLKARTCLADAINPDGALDETAMPRLLRAVSDAANAARDQKVDELIVLATATLRQASNARLIRDRIRTTTGIDPSVLSGEDEASLTFLAAHRWFGWSAAPLLLIDVGGGSTEIAYGHDANATWAVSVPLGAGNLTRALLPDHPASPRQVKAARRAALTAFAAAADRERLDTVPRRVVGTSKTFKQLARLSGAAAWRHGPHRLRSIRRGDLRQQIGRLAALTPERRAELRGVEPSRARQILAGAILAEAAMRTFAVDSIDVIAWAVREGILLRRLAMLPDPTHRRQAELISAATTRPDRAALAALAGG